MRVWLAISGGLFVAWTFLLLLVPTSLLSAAQSESHAGFILILALLQLLLALLAWWSALRPRRRHVGIYTTILALLVKWIVDLYGVLVSLPPQQAALTLGDLILSVALLVGVLEALPRALGVQSAS